MPRHESAATVSLDRLRKARSIAAALLVRDGGEALTLVFERLDDEVRAAERRGSATQRARELLFTQQIP